MTQQGWHFKQGSTSWGVGTHDFYVMAFNFDTYNNLGEMPMHLDGTLLNRSSHSNLE